MFRQKLKALRKPDMYHGWGKTKNYFEGWYFKLIDATEKHALAIIPGISISPEGEQGAFIQILDGKACTAAFIPFDANTFSPDNDRFFVKIKYGFFGK